MPRTSRKNLKNVRVGLVGPRGRMGRHIRELIDASDALSLAFEVGRDGAWPARADGVDVVVDFSQPAGLERALAWCSKHRVALVSGTTGIGANLRKRMKAASRRIPILYSANMSPGIAVLSAMLDHFARLRDWDFHVDEIHHARKKDAPSGTAKLIDQRLAEVLGRETPSPNSIRGGSVPGLHQVWAMGEDEVLLLQHTALDRHVFARGAIRAAGWLFDKGEPGFYELKDLYK